MSKMKFTSSTKFTLRGSYKTIKVNPVRWRFVKDVHFKSLACKNMKNWICVLGKKQI